MHKRILGILSSMLFIGGLLFITIVPNSLPAKAINSQTTTRGFNDKHCYALAIGVPNENLGNEPDKVDAGAINVIYGYPGTGLDYPGNLYWNLDETGIGSVGEDGESNEEFGNALAAGDFDGDGYEDLAVGIHWRIVGGDDNAGAVHVFYSSWGGLTTTGDYMWHQDKLPAGASEPGDEFGDVLAVGDFDGDSYDDLAIGIPGEDIGDPVINNAGAVEVLYGSSVGLSSSRDEIWTQNSVGIQEDAETDNFFGSALAVGDFNGDGYDDLAIGVPFESVGAIANAGAVNIIYGSGDGLQIDDNMVWNQNSSLIGNPIEDDSEATDNFGWSLSAGDFDGDGNDDLAIGVPYEDDEAGPVTDAGVVHVLYGTADNGIYYFNDELIWQNDVGSLIEEDDHFGSVLAAGNFDGDDYDDLAIGAPDEDHPSSLSNSGVVHVIYGNSYGLLGGTTTINFFCQGSGAPGTNEAEDKFGYALAAGDFNCDDYADLAIGAPYDDDISEDDGAGVVTVMFGGSISLSGAGAQTWSQASEDPPEYIGGSAEAGDHFGKALIAIQMPRNIFLPIVIKN